MVIEAGVVAGYLIAWAIRKARRVGDRLDKDADAAIDGSLDRLHEFVAEKLGGHPALADMEEEATSRGGGEIRELTRKQVELALESAAGKEPPFGEAVMEFVARVREAERAAGTTVIAAPGSTVFTGDAKAKADNGGIAIGQAGSVTIRQGLADPTRPGRSSR